MRSHTNPISKPVQTPLEPLATQQEPFSTHKEHRTDAVPPKQAVPRLGAHLDIRFEVPFIAGEGGESE